LIQREHELLTSEVKNLIKFRIPIDSINFIDIKYDMNLTIIEGKVLSAVLGVSSAQVCPICLAKPSSFNTLSNSFFFLENRLKYGINPLHAWIRCLEFCLHLSYRVGIEKWQARGPVLKVAVETRKRKIQKDWIKKMGLRVDFRKTNGSGPSYDENTARCAFSDPETFSEILGVEKRLVQDLGTILIALNCQFSINKIKFQEFCTSLANWYVLKYKWFYMPVSVHKILIHVGDIIGASILPLGMLGEDAGESLNKYYKRDRLHHSTKTTRTLTMTDMFNRAMDTSDPKLSTASLASREKSRKRKALPFVIIFVFMLYFYIA